MPARLREFFARLNEKTSSRIAPRRAPDAGLTLIEIVVVLLILGIVIAWVGGKIVGGGEKAKRGITEGKIKEMGMLIAEFQLRYNTLPNSLDEMVRCTERLGPNCIPVVTDPNSLKDAWGNEFAYTLEEGGRRYRLKSYGADGKEGGEGLDSDPFGTGP